MIGISDIKSGMIIAIDGQPHKVLSSEHSKMGRMGAVLRTKLRNLITGAVFDKTFQGADKVAEATVTTQPAQYLYSDDTGYTFMDMTTYEQFTLDGALLENATAYLTEGMEVTVALFEGTPIDIRLPVKVALKVTDAPPSIKGNTSSGGSKVVTVETGAQFQTPLFVTVGDTIIINTEKGTYVGKE